MARKAVFLIRIFLILVGGASIWVDQISYTRHEKVLEIGPFEATMKKEAHCLRLPVVFGILVAAAGVCLILLQLKKSP